jgi:DNA polymerase-3 subunit beta
MKITCSRSGLADVLNIANAVAASRTPKPIFQCIKLEASDGQVDVSATDMEVGVRCRLRQVQVDAPGEVLLEAERLVPIVRESLDETLTLEVEQEVCHLTGQDSHYSLFTFPPDDFPGIPDLEGDPDFQISDGELREAIQRTSFAAARENTRFAIHGVLWERSGGKLHLVSTDGRRLARAVAKTNDGKAEDGSSIVPIKVMQLIERITVDPDEKLGIKFTENQIIVLSSTAVVSGILVEGRFPQYDNIIPQDLDKRLEFDSGQFLSAIRRAALLTDDDSKGVRLSFSPGRLQLASRAAKKGEATVNMDVAYEGDEVEVGFNPHFLEDALRVLGGQNVMFNFKASDRPAVLRVGNEFLYVVMPVSLS